MGITGKNLEDSGYIIRPKSLVPDTGFIKSSLGLRDHGSEIVWQDNTKNEDMKNKEEKPGKKFGRRISLAPIDDILEPGKDIKDFLHYKRSSVMDKSKSIDLKTLELKKKKELLRIKYNQLLEEEKKLLDEIEQSQKPENGQLNKQKPYVNPINPKNFSSESIQPLNVTEYAQDNNNARPGHNAYENSKVNDDYPIDDSSANRAHEQEQAPAIYDEIENRLEQRYDELIKEKMGIIKKNMDMNSKLAKSSSKVERGKTLEDKKDDLDAIQRDIDEPKRKHLPKHELVDKIRFHKEWLGQMMHELDSYEEIPIPDCRNPLKNNREADVRNIEAAKETPQGHTEHKAVVKKLLGKAKRYLDKFDFENALATVEQAKEHCSIIDIIEDEKDRLKHEIDFLEQKIREDTF